MNSQRTRGPNQIQTTRSPLLVDPSFLSPNRRSFLKAIGAGLASLPFIELLSNSAAQAAGEDLPLKLVTLYHPHGVAAEYWAMRDTDTETAFDLTYENCSLQPFDDAATYGKSFKDRILPIQGIELLSAANGHETAATILTGSRVVSAKPGNISLDQHLAVNLGLGSSSRVASVAIAVGLDGSEPGSTLSYGEGGIALPKLIDPVAFFDLCFSGFVVGDDPEAQAKAARQRQLGKSIIDFVNADINRLHPRLAPREQQKLDQHLTAMRELEKQFTESELSASCTLPQVPNPADFPSIKAWNGGEPYYDAITNAFIDVLSQALACGITRFATFYMNDLSYAGNPLGLNADNHGGVAHIYNASTVGNNNITQAGDPKTWLPLAQINKYNYGKMALLMQKLDALGVLDSTLLYASSDMGNPALHSTRNVPTVLAGGAGGKFRMGRRLKMANDCPPENQWCDENTGNMTPNNKLLVSIAQAFGAEIDTFGTQPDPKFNTGALDGLV